MGSHGHRDSRVLIVVAIVLVGLKVAVIGGILRAIALVLLVLLLLDVCDALRHTRREPTDPTGESSWQIPFQLEVTYRPVPTDAPNCGDESLGRLYQEPAAVSGCSNGSGRTVTGGDQRQ